MLLSIGGSVTLPAFLEKIPEPYGGHHSISPAHLLSLLRECKSLVATAALAQAINYTSVEATSGKAVRLIYHASAHKNCTAARLPTDRVSSLRHRVC